MGNDEIASRRSFCICDQTDTESQPPDWGKGYDNVTMFCKLPVKYKGIICELILETIDLKAWLGKGIELVIAGGESGDNARPCDFDWVMQIRKDCIESRIPLLSNRQVRIL